MTTVPRALTIAGSDSGGGAGIQADLKTFTVMGVYGTSVITAVTAQNTVGVSGVYPLTAKQVTAQLDAVLPDIGADAVKTGMLMNADIIHAVAEGLLRHRVSRLVVDPVMIAKSGHALLEDEARTALIEQFLPITHVVTPNVPEAAALTGMQVRTREQMADAGRRLLDFGPRAALITAGHLGGDRADDVLVTASGTEWFEATKIATTRTHGTGCTLSAAIAAGLAAGLTLSAAVRRAKAFINVAIETAPAIGSGHGPTNHLAWLERTNAS